MENNSSWLDKPALRWTLVAVTFSLVFAYHSFPLGLSDFWWHLNTARWIWEHGSMPVDDPFLYSSPSPLDGRATLILRGYPLSQLLMYGLYSLGGIQALVWLKAALMSAFYALLWNQLRRKGLHPVLALAVVAPLPLLFFRFDELRPQVFSFIGTLLVMQLTEYLLERERQGRPPHLYALSALPLLMLLWANLHRGYIIGVGILLIYLLAEWLARKRGREGLPDEAFRRLLMVVAAAVAVSFLNPVGLTAIWASFTEVAGPFSKVVDEFFPTLKYFEFHGSEQIGYVVLGVALMPSLALLLKWRRVNLAHALILLPFLIAGILSFRFSLMMVAVALVIAGGYFSADLNRWLLKGKGVPALLLWCAATGLLASDAMPRAAYGKAPLEAGVIPATAADYLAQARVNGELYNTFESGGYLSWRLYPVRLFIDPRNLSWEVYEDYMKVWRGEYQSVFDRHRVGAVFYPVFGRDGKPTRLVWELFKSTDWGVGYYDGRNIVMIRHSWNPSLPYLGKREVADDIMRRMRGDDGLR